MRRVLLGYCIRRHWTFDRAIGKTMCAYPHVLYPDIHKACDELVRRGANTGVPGIRFKERVEPVYMMVDS